MVSEKALNPKAFGQDGGDNERWTNAGWDEDVVRFGAHQSGVGIPPIPDQEAPGPPDWNAVPSMPGNWTKWHPFFGSSHAAGVNACMVDGSVRMFAFDVDREVFRRVSLTDDGESVSLD
jgi:prepilin-type processing-associated H-X9-DG protein